MAEPAPPAAKPRDDGDLDQAIGAWLRIVAPVGVVLGAVYAGFSLGVHATFLVLASGALLAVIAVCWASLRTLLGETPMRGADAYALGTRSAEDERKRAVLRALKDLELEHSLGKITEEDYAELRETYRTEARRLLKRIDDLGKDDYERVERLVAKRLAAEGLREPPPEPEVEAPEPAEPRPAGPSGKKRKGRKGPAEASPACAACGTRNDADARFCKSCGAALGTATPTKGDPEPEESA